MAHDQGFDLRYTPFTRKEYKEAISRAGRQLEKYSGTSDPDYIQRRMRNSIIKEFFRQRNRATETGVVAGRDKKEFIKYYDRLHSRLNDLEGLQIGMENISADHQKKIRESDEYAELYSTALALHDIKEKAEHDALAVCYVKSLRDEEAGIEG